MTNTVKERLQPEFAKAKQASQQRAARISDILKSATSMTFDEYLFSVKLLPIPLNPP